MTPKHKAEELIEKFSKSTLIFYDRVGLSEVKYEAKRCALIAVDEMIIQNGELYLNGLDNIYYRKINNFLFEVKQEIKKL
tara:strand:- start:1326 stop:1565 length:240 start_codon:yes stop_codon:yes gene_type:complete